MMIEDAAHSRHIHCSRRRTEDAIPIARLELIRLSPTFSRARPIFHSFITGTRIDDAGFGQMPTDGIATMRKMHFSISLIARETVGISTPMRRIQYFLAFL